MRYEDENHFKSENGYELEGVWYPRVTRILDIKSKPGLDQFMREMGSFAAAEDVKNKSAEEGSLVHSTIEKILKGEKVDVPQEIAPAIASFDEYRKKAGIIFYPDFLERRVWSVRHRYAGTIDALASVNGKFGVLDIKTSGGFWPEYNLQTAAYLSALQEFFVKRALNLPYEVTTRWILRVDQYVYCRACGASLRKKGGRIKVRNGKTNSALCPEADHAWGETVGEVEIREFPYLYDDIKAFIAAKILWEWEHGYWLRKINYLK